MGTPEGADSRRGKGLGRIGRVGGVAGPRGGVGLGRRKCRRDHGDLARRGRRVERRRAHHTQEEGRGRGCERDRHHAREDRMPPPGRRPVTRAAAEPALEGITHRTGTIAAAAGRRQQPELLQRSLALQVIAEHELLPDSIEDGKGACSSRDSQRVVHRDDVAVVENEERTDEQPVRLRREVVPGAAVSLDEIGASAEVGAEVVLATHVRHGGESREAATQPLHESQLAFRPGRPEIEYLRSIARGDQVVLPGPVSEDGVNVPHPGDGGIVRIDGARVGCDAGQAGALAVLADDETVAFPAHALVGGDREILRQGRHLELIPVQFHDPLATQRGGARELGPVAENAHQGIRLVTGRHRRRTQGEVAVGAVHRLERSPLPHDHPDGREQCQDVLLVPERDEQMGDPWVHDRPRSVGWAGTPSPGIGFRTNPGSSSRFPRTSGLPLLPCHLRRGGRAV